MFYQYTQVMGSIRYAVVADVSEAKIRQQYGDELKKYEPYVVINTAMADAMECGKRNDAKFAWRSVCKDDSFGYTDGTTEIFQGEKMKQLIIDSDLSDLFVKAMDEKKFEQEHMQQLQLLKNAIESLSTIQRRRCVLYYEGKLTEQQIADLEEVGRTSIRDSLSCARKNIQKYFKCHSIMTA